MDVWLSWNSLQYHIYTKVSGHMKSLHHQYVCSVRIHIRWAAFILLVVLFLVLSVLTWNTDWSTLEDSLYTFLMILMMMTHDFCGKQTLTAIRSYKCTTTCCFPAACLQSEQVNKADDHGACCTVCGAKLTPSGKMQVLAVQQNLWMMPSLF